MSAPTLLEAAKEIAELVYDPDAPEDAEDTLLRRWRADWERETGEVYDREWADEFNEWQDNRIRAKLAALRAAIKAEEERRAAAEKRVAEAVAFVREYPGQVPPQSGPTCVSCLGTGETCRDCGGTGERKP